MKYLVALLALSALAACGSKEAKTPQGSSFGQVLPGSASDAMLPYDTASSAPPLDERQYDPEPSSSAAPRTRAAKPRVSEEAEVAPEAVAT